MKKIFLPTIVILATLVLPLRLMPEVLTYQARIFSASHPEGPHAIGFRIYDAVGTVLWGETQSVQVDRGIISVRLGVINSIPWAVLSPHELYLGLTVGTDAEMTPRRPLASTWKSISAHRASGRSVQAGGGVFTVTNSDEGSVAITFSELFTAPPVVTAGAPRDAISSVYFIPTRVSNITPSGCIVHFSSLEGAPASGSAEFDWIAIGE